MPRSDIQTVLGDARELLEIKQFRARFPERRAQRGVSIYVYPSGGRVNPREHMLLISTGFPPADCLRQIEVWMWVQSADGQFDLLLLGSVSKVGKLRFDGGDPGRPYYLTATAAYQKHATLFVPQRGDTVLVLARDARNEWELVTHAAAKRPGESAWTLPVGAAAGDSADVPATQYDRPARTSGCLFSLEGGKEPAAAVRTVDEITDQLYVAGLCRRAADGEPYTITGDFLRKLQLLLRRPLKFDPALHELRDCTTVEAVLRWLLPRARQCGLNDIRYYPLSRDARGVYRLCSHASAGHDEVQARRLRMGQIIKFLDRSPLRNQDSFWSVALGVPAIFVFDDSFEEEIECSVERDSLPLVRVRQNRCAKVLERNRGDAWIDLPLLVGQVPVGKLSCDLQVPVRVREGSYGGIEPGLTDLLLQLNELAQLVAPRLDSLYHQELERHACLPSPDEVGQQINSECDSCEALERYCTTQIPHLLSSKYGSILITSRDTLGSELLVFRKTSYPKSQREQLLSAYWFTEDTLTSWVAREGTGICLQDLGDPDLRRDKLREYDPELTWRNKIQDSDNHGDLLVVPIRGKSGVIGVLRYTQRLRGHFTEKEQRWLEQICRRYLGPKLECLWRTRSDQLVEKHGSQIAAISIRDSVTNAETPGEIAHEVGGVIQQILGDSPGNKTILVNMIEADRTHFVHHAVINRLHGKLDERYALAGSLTGYVMSHSGVVFLNDLEAAAAAGYYRPVLWDALCALACRIGPEHRPYGAIVVLSDRYDISDRVHGAVLKLIADRVAEILHRRKVVSLLSEGESRAAGLKVALRRIEQIMRRDRQALKDEDYRDAGTLVSLAAQMVDALTQVGPTSKDFTKQFRMFHVRETIERAASLVIPGHMLMSSIDEHLQVTAQEGFFVMIICDLLRNAWRFSSEVAVSAAPRRAAGGEQWLDICIESRGECRPQLTDYDDRGILAALNLDSYAELRGSKSLARSYRLPDGRSGSVTENRYHANYRCTFQLPLAAECPLPSDC